MNKFKLSFVALLFSFSTITFASDWQSVEKISIETSDTADPPYKMDFKYSLGHTKGKLPGDHYKSSGVTQGSKGVRQEYFSKYTEILNDEIASKNKDDILTVITFVLYQNTPGDLTNCDIANYDVSGKTWVNVKITDGVCSLA